MVLVGALFIPFLLTVEHRSQPETVSESPIMVPVPVAQKPPPRELMRIYSIVRSHRPDITEAEAWELSEVILEESSGYGLDPMLVLAVIDVESKFQYEAVSPAGARESCRSFPMWHNPSYRKSACINWLMPNPLDPSSDDPLST
jgi:hypothetical protein